MGSKSTSHWRRKHRNMAKGCLKNISSVLKVSSCYSKNNFLQFFCGFKFGSNLSFWVLSQFKFFSLVPIWVVFFSQFYLMTWSKLRIMSFFCNMSIFSFVTFLVAQFCHTFSFCVKSHFEFWVLLHLEFLSCHIWSSWRLPHFELLSFVTFEFESFVTFWVFSFFFVSCWVFIFFFFTFWVIEFCPFLSFLSFFTLSF